MESWVGKSINSSITMAISDFYACNDSYRSKIALHPRDSQGDPLEAMSNSKIIYSYYILCSVLYCNTSLGGYFRLRVGVGYKVHFSYKVYKVIKHYNVKHKTHLKPTNNIVEITKTPYLWVCVVFWMIKL
ncbi:hypothetical protein HanRHA438_Chr09g0408181 [Helianthus annuus]|uniref:Uncharacterized protein n=1 Tax=Helianthus annuus TaxID=4232 RepID=A0A9K3I7A8_HELAN|nr:hypothetical protein HanXRQr2_Chr09g0396391 [Helianthus annuus]KAJ0526620.1 hypothetical protein HanHA300_Chr09g0325241 [Helianthus annuus]KAJ0543013.1 hypothetical protein HanHA89_Chr09g0346151 [Helianthus annuus]KAJ0708067.1 hypothetical protein HanLR1_Chr09g0325471 [Helianthus annuus]KAJ0712036.1 hypothetical protein HanOQP8_Chr09g0330501 [Helianthus annuus]